MLIQIALQSRDLNMSIIEGVFLSIKLSVKIRVLLLSINKEIFLVIDFLSQGLNHVDVNFDSAPVVLFHSSFVIGYSVEILFQTKKLILQVFVLAFSGSKIHSFLTKLGY